MARWGSPARRIAGVLGLVFMALVAAACVESPLPQSTIHPVSDFGWKIQDLYVLIFWLAVFVFVVVEGVLLYAVLRFRRRPDDGLPPQIHGNARLEVAWTLAPAVILAIIAVPTVRTIFDTQSNPPQDALEIRVVGHQWWWEVQYPDHNIVTANEVRVPVGQPVLIKLESVDVIHSFWVPRVGGKMDVVPNHVNQMWFTVDTPGVYPGQCVEFCGTQHANMKFVLVAQTPEEFQAWVAEQQRVPPTPTEGLAARGAELFAKGACVGCHTVQGTPAQGKVGPDLTHIGSRLTIGAGMLENTPENLALWLKDPQAVKPGNKMPALGLSEGDVEALVAYLHSLR